MTGPDLRAALHELSDDVRTPDLLDRTLATSRHIRRRRVVVAATGTVAVLAAVGVGVAMVRPPDTVVAPPATRSSTSAESPTQPTPPASTTAVEQPAEPNTPSQPASESAPGGSVYYFRMNQQRGHGEVLTLRTDGTIDRVDIPTDVFGTASVSPNGRYIAWVAEPGHLTVSDIDGRNARVIASDAVPMDHNVPAWSPDSRAVTYNAAAGPLDGPRTTIGPMHEVGIDGANPRRVWDNGLCFPAWTADHRHLAYSNCTGGAGVLDVRDGTHHGPNLIGIDGTNYVAGVSPDGRQILVKLGDRPAVPRRSGEQRLALFDVMSGDRLAMPVAGDVSGGSFLANGDLLLRVVNGNGAVITRVDRHGRIVAQATEPAQLRDAGLIGFSPG